MVVRRFIPRGLGRILLAANLAALFGLALWFRVTSLESFPEPNGDEAWYGVQAEHLLQGRPFSPRTGNGNPVNPFHAGFEVLLLLGFPPSLWILRASAVAGGVAAVGLTYPLIRRALDRPTALIAAALLAVLPIAILYSRIGYDCSQTPLFSLLALTCAFRLRRAGLILAFALCLVAHPSNVFLLPTLLAVYLVREAQGWADSGDSRRPARVLLVASALAGMVGAAVLYQRKMARDFYAIRSYDLGRYLKFFGRHLLAGDLDTGRVQDVAFWAVVLIVLVPGVRRLVRDRCWDRLALLAGLILSAAGYFLVVGAGGLHPAGSRYGLFLVVPAVLAVACLARSSLIAPRGRAFRVAGMMAVGWALLLGFKVNRFDSERLPLPFTAMETRPRPAATGHRRESPWTLGTDVPDPNVQAYRVILHDLGREPGPRRGATTILTQNWWLYRPLQYLAARRMDLKVVDHGKVPCPSPQRYVDHLRDQLLAGAYVVTYPDQFLENFVNDVIPPAALRRWEIRHFGIPYIRVLRLKDGREGVSRSEVAGPRVVLGQPAAKAVR